MTFREVFFRDSSHANLFRHPFLQMNKASLEYGPYNVKDNIPLTSPVKKEEGGGDGDGDSDGDDDDDDLVIRGTINVSFIEGGNGEKSILRDFRQQEIANKKNMDTIHGGGVMRNMFNFVKTLFYHPHHPIWTPNVDQCIEIIRMFHLEKKKTTSSHSNNKKYNGYLQQINQHKMWGETYNCLQSYIEKGLQARHLNDSRELSWILSVFPREKHLLFERNILKVNHEPTVVHQCQVDQPQTHYMNFASNPVHFYETDGNLVEKTIPHISKEFSKFNETQSDE